METVKAPILFIYGLTIPTDSDGKAKEDINGNQYMTIYGHGLNVDEDGCEIEPVKGQMSLNAGISPVLFKSVYDRCVAGHSKDIQNGVEVLMLDKPLKTRGLVERRKATNEFYLVDDNNNRLLNDDQEERTGKFVTLMVLGVTEDEVKASVDKAYADRMDYYKEADLFVDSATAAKPAIKTLIDAGN
jgi:hypothetical protein